GGLGSAARRAPPAPPHRRFRGHRHLPRRIHPRAAGRGAITGGRGADDPARARRRLRNLPPWCPGGGRPGAAPALRPARGRPGVVCGSRPVPRKGQDPLIRAWPEVRAAAPDAVLLLVGGGPYAGRLRRLASGLGVAGSVVFTGPVPWPELPAHYDAGDVFAM